MAFSPNHSITYISVAEPNLLSLSRSTHTAVPADKLFRGHPCEAYICTARGNEQLRIYVAIIDTSTRIPQIFTSECDAKEMAVFRELTAEAERFVASMGFAMELVSLDYSPAMRQVIMRGISILHPPDPIRTHKNAGMAALPDTAAQKPHLALVATPPPSALGSSPAASAPTGELPKSTAPGPAEENDLLRSEGVGQDAGRRIKELEDRLAEAGAVAQAAESGLQTIIVALRNEVAALQNSLETSESERQVLLAELDSVSDALRAQNKAESLWREEREALEHKYEKRCEEYSQLETLLAEARKANEDLVLEQEWERRRAVGELSSITSKLERLSAEKNVWDSIALSFKKKARTAVERLRREKSALEEQLRQLADKGHEAAQPQAAAGVSPQPVSFYEPSPVAGFSLGPAFAGFAASTAGSVADFRYEPEIQTVIYHSAEEIVDLYGSGNMIQAAPFGRRSQNCNAYICVVERSGQREINLAWQLVDNGEVLICLPEKQPDETRSYDRMLQDALFYFESVGFMMNRFEISRGSERQLQALEKTGVCRREEKQAGGDPWLMIAAA